MNWQFMADTLQNTFILGLAVCLIIQGKTMKRMMQLFKRFKARSIALNPEPILCSQCGMFQAFRDGKCDICLGENNTIEVATVEDAIALLDLQSKWSNSLEGDR